MDSTRGKTTGRTSVAPRYKLCVPVEYRWIDGKGVLEDFHGDGILWNVSTSGARIEHPSIPVTPGTELGIRFSFFTGSSATEVPSEAVRQTEEGGFAVRFAELTPEHARMLNRALPS